MFGPKRNLSVEDFRRSQLLYRGKINAEFYHGTYEVFILDNDQAYIRQDMHNIPIVGFFPDIEIYRIDGEEVLIYLKNWVYTYVKPIKVITSKLTESFAGFKLGRLYELQNGQVWEQISDNTTNAISSGHVKIVDDKTMYVDSWRTSVEVVKNK